MKRYYTFNTRTLFLLWQHLFFYKARYICLYECVVPSLGLQKCTFNIIAVLTLFLQIKNLHNKNYNRKGAFRRHNIQ